MTDSSSGAKQKSFRKETGTFLSFFLQKNKLHSSEEKQSQSIRILSICPEAHDFIENAEK
jgi:hypothetical protein